MANSDLNKNYQLLQAYKKALENNVDLSVVEFCRRNDIKPKLFSGWLQRNGILIVDIKNEVRMHLGLPLLPKDQASQYSMILEEFRMRLSIEPGLTLASYCDEISINSTAFQKWLRRNNYTVLAIRRDVLGERPTTKKHITKDDFGQLARKRFSDTLEGFKKYLRTHKSITLSAYCKKKGVDYVEMKRWMKLNGVSENQIKIADKIRRANESSPVPNMLPANPDNIFIQFKPNGRTNGDLLKGVAIRFPDGKLLQVDECTVVSLCSFISMYDKNQH